MAVGHNPLFGPSISEAELYAAWVGIVYARYSFQADQLVIEDDFSNVISWIQSYITSAASYPLLHNIRFLLGSVALLMIRYVCHEINFDAD